MKHKNFKIAAILIGLALVFGLFAAPAQAVLTYGLSLQAKDGSGAEKTDFIRGEKLYLHIIATELQDVAGCAFTLNYNSAILTAPVTDSEGVAAAGITSYFPFTFVKDSVTTVTMRENSSTPGTILFSGAEINTATGGGKHATPTPGETLPLFIVEFTVKTDAAFGTGYLFSLVQTTLHNPAAGYGTEGQTDTVAVPVLVGANPKGDGSAATWTDLTQAFPILMPTLGTTTETFNVIDVPTYTISGNIGYAGKQAGTLKVAAFTNQAWGTQAGQAFSATWTGSSMTYTVTGLLASANGYYIGAFIDSGTTNTTPATTEAQGAYSTAIPISTSPGNVTGKDIALTETQTDGLPAYWVALYPGIGNATADYDHDGYSNLVEYRNGTNPTVVNDPKGTDYDPTTDTRSYGISGTITYAGTKTGTLYVAAFAPSDTNYATPLNTPQPYTWNSGDTSKAYTLNLLNGSYKIGAFIGSSATRQSTDAVGNYTTVVVLAGTPQVNRNFMLLDSSQKKQIVSASPTEPRAKATGSFSIDVNYTTSDLDKTTGGLTIRMHYDSTKLTFAGISNTLPAFSGGTTPQTDTNNADGDDTTDKYVTIGWADGSGQWPNLDLPTRLFTATFNVADLPEGTESVIRFSLFDQDISYAFYADPANFKVQSFNLNVDGSTEVSPTPSARVYTDGLMIIRYLMGLQEEDVTRGLIPVNATRTWEQITSYLDTAGTSAQSPLNVDGSPETSTPAARVYTDGLMIIRYLMGLQEEDVTRGLIPVNATRTSWEQITSYLDQLKP